MRRTCAIVGALLAVLAGCGGSNGAESAAARPAPGSEAVAAELEALPLPPRTTPYGPAARTRGVLAQSFRTTGFTPSSLISFFDERLAPDGWIRTTPVHRENTTGRADFTRGSERLEISSTPVPHDPGVGSEKAVVQFSLVLRPTSGGPSP